MYRGTTPQFVFKFPFDVSEFSVLYVTFGQGSGRKIDKTLSDSTVDGDTLTVKLTQQETLSMSPGTVNVQIRAKKPDGTALASNIVSLNVKNIIKGGGI
jgi:hypothetical protein